MYFLYFNFRLPFFGTSIPNTYKAKNIQNADLINLRQIRLLIVKFAFLF
jgi:hypothetical protein